MARPKPTLPETLADVLTPKERVILFCAATDLDHAAVGILAGEMRAMDVRGMIERDPSGRYVLTDMGRYVFRALLNKAGVADK
jgi:hypothetical protein